MKKFLIVFLLIVQPLTSGWHDRRCEGWAYFQDSPTLKKENSKPKQKDPLEFLEEQKKELELRFAKALLDPTDENISAYLDLHNKWLKKAEEFSQAFSKIVLQNPNLYSLSNGVPTSNEKVKRYPRKKSPQQNNLRK